MAFGADSRSPSGPLRPDADAISLAAERFARAKVVFLAALDQPESVRLDFVTRSCEGDADLQAEVFSLLASERAADSFGETPAAALLADSAVDAAPTPRLEPGTLLGPYEITEFLSAGGMGEVYRARHTVLHRAVAIKTLSGHTTEPHAKRRLLREAQHAATLNHPNICRIYEVGTAEDMPFIVMELVDGSTLSAIVRANRPALDRALVWAMTLADALEHAHTHGIVHRDLKSSNVVVNAQGKPIVLDFGLAKRLDTTGGTLRDSTMTVTGMLAGTPSHMAPEVLVGSAADARSDIWSLGVLLYEMTTGELPFQGRTAFETSSVILGEPPRPIARTVPLALRLIIERCLAKDPAARYQHAADVRDALDAVQRRRSWPLVGRLLISSRRRTIAGAAGVAALAVSVVAVGARVYEDMSAGRIGRISTVALLPLENATGDPNAAYYADGLTEALIDQLGALADVRVIARTSAVRAAGAAATRVEAARQLGAGAVLEGRLRQASDRIAVDVRLIEATKGRVVWSDTYERAANQVLALQADVVRALAAEIKLGVRPGAGERLATVRAVNPAAYEEYLRGRFEWNRRTTQSLDRAVAHFTRATELDPTYAPAYAALADCYNQFGTMMVGTGSPREHRPRAAAAAIRALQIDPFSAEAHATLGYVRHYNWEFDQAEREFKRAIELNPSYALARIWYANLLMSRRRFDEALEEVYAARELDPFSLIINTNVAWVLIAKGRYHDAIAQLRSTLELDSTYAHAHWRMAGALMGAGRPAEAYAHAVRLVELTNRSPPSLGLLGVVSAQLGNRDELRAILAEVLDRNRAGYVPPATIADLYLGLGNIDSALVWLPKAFDERANYVAYLNLDTAAGPLQRDPRFRALVSRAGLTQ